MNKLNEILLIVKCLLSVAFALGLVICTNAQDVIYKCDKSSIQCKVIKISKSEIEYKKWTNIDGPIYSIDVEDVIRIDYQNGESEIFTNSASYDTIQGFMTREFTKLVLDGRVLSDEEVELLLNNKDYNTYIGARKQWAAGTGFAFVFFISAIGDIAGYNGMINGNTAEDKAKSAAILYGSLLLTNISAPFMCAFIGIAKGRMNWLINNFNDKHAHTITINVSPSIINCEMPQLQNTYGLGVTLRANF